MWIFHFGDSSMENASQGKWAFEHSDSFVKMPYRTEKRIRPLGIQVIRIFGHPSLISSPFPANMPTLPVYQGGWWVGIDQLISVFKKPTPTHSLNAQQTLTFWAISFGHSPILWAFFGVDTGQQTFFNIMRNTKASSFEPDLNFGQTVSGFQNFLGWNKV